MSRSGFAFFSMVYKDSVGQGVPMNGFQTVVFPRHRISDVFSWGLKASQVHDVVHDLVDESGQLTGFGQVLTHVLVYFLLSFQRGGKKESLRGSSFLSPGVPPSP